MGIRFVAIQVAAIVVSSLSVASVGAATLHVPRDHKTIQAAIDVAKRGDTVLVEPGTYPGPIHLKEGVILKSAGDDNKGKTGLKRTEATIVDGGGAEAKGPAVVLAAGAILDGFTVTRVGLFDQKEYDKHYATSGEHLPDDRGAVGAGKDFPAVAISGVSAVVKHCIVHDNGRPGIGCMGKGNASWIIGNVVFRNMGGGIGVSDGAAPTVEANTCYNNLRSGIGNRNSAGLILNNHCFDNVRAGIGIREGAKPIARGNKCYKNRRAGIGNRMAGTAPIIEDNDCYQNVMAGIGTRDGASPLIRGNRCYENELAGIGSKEDAQPTIVGNHVHHNKKAGIGFDDCKAGRATVLDNKVIDNGLVAVGIHGGWHVRLIGNELSRKDGLPPIVMVFKGSEAELCDNLIRGSGVAGVRTEGSARMVKNRFECPSLRKAGPPQYAVWALPGADIVFLDNKVSGWRHALFTDKAAVIASYNRVWDYWQIGIKINQPTRPTTALGNIFWSEAGHAGVSVTGDQGISDANRVEKGTPPPKNDDHGETK